MTKAEFCKKHCYNGHDPNNCHMMEDLDKVIEYYKQWNTNFFTGNEPGGIVLQTDISLTEEKYQELKKAWEARHKGPTELTKDEEDIPPMEQRNILNSVCGENGYWCMSALCTRCEGIGLQ